MITGKGNKLIRHSQTSVSAQIWNSRWHYDHTDICTLTFSLPRMAAMFHEKEEVKPNLEHAQHSVCWFNRIRSPKTSVIWDSLPLLRGQKTLHLHRGTEQRTPQDAELVFLTLPLLPRLMVFVKCRSPSALSTRLALQRPRWAMRCAQWGATSSGRG